MIPSFPDGATLLSLYEASAWIGRFASPRSGMNAVSKHRPSANHFFLGYRADDFCRVVLDGAIKPSTLLQKHTLFPIFSNLLRPQIAENFSRALISGSRSRKSIGSLQKYSCSSYVSKNVRFCLQCAVEDLKTHDFAYQRLSHQLITAYRCMHHGLELWEVCSCTTRINRWSNIISACPSCRKNALSLVSKSPKKNVYAICVLNDGLRRLLAQNAPELLIKHMNISPRDIIARHGENHQSIVKKFLDWIQIKNLSDLSEVFKTDEHGIDLDSALTLGWSRSPRIDLAVLSFTWEHLPTSLKEQLISS